MLDRSAKNFALLVWLNGVSCPRPRRDFTASTGSKDDVNGAYFNPKNYNESMLAIGFRKRISNWSTNLILGYGREKINNDSSQSKKQVNFSKLIEKQSRDG